MLVMKILFNVGRVVIEVKISDLFKFIWLVRIGVLGRSSLWRFSFCVMVG